MKDTITLTMIVRNEEHHLRACLDSARDYVDEIVIVDTGSTDRTVEIALTYTDKVYHQPWQNDFSLARNLALSKSTCSWILVLDADEVLEVDSGASLRSIINQAPLVNAYLFTLFNPTAHLSEEYNRFQVLRLFRNNGDYRFVGKIHEQVLIAKSQGVALAEGIIIKHQMLAQSERNRKRQRNLTLLLECVSLEPDNLFLQYYLGLEWLMLNKPFKAFPHLAVAYQNISSEYPMFRTPALRCLVICLQALGQLDEAICVCLDASIEFPGYADVYYLGGILLEEKGEYRLALKWLAEALKSGSPPPLYSHIVGSSNFLALYHMGICCDLLGERTQARSFYEQALKANPCYLPPLYNLFLAVLSEFGPSGTLDYLTNLLADYEKSCKTSILTASTLAEMFLQKGYPDFAWQLLKSQADALLATVSPPASLLLDLGKYALFSGKVAESQEVLLRIPHTSELYSQSLFFCSFGSLLIGDYPTSRQYALRLWKHHAYRCHAFLLLVLMKQSSSKHRNRIQVPVEISGINTGVVAMTILTDCLSFQPTNELRAKLGCLSHLKPQSVSLGESLELVGGALADIILASPASRRSVAAFHRSQQQAWHSFLNYKFFIKEGDDLCNILLD